MDSIDIFNVAALEVMSQCLETFPVPAEIQHKEVAKKLEGFFKDPESYDEAFEQIVRLDEVALYTLYWLINEDFIIDKGSTMDSFYVTLSHKGLNALNSTPDALTDKKPLRAKVKEGLSKISLNSASAVMVEFFKSVG